MSQTLEQFAQTVSSASNLEGLTRPMLELLQRITRLETTYLTTIHEEDGVQKILYARNIGKLNIPEGLEVPWSDTLCKRALDEKQFLTTDVPACWGDSEAARALNLKTYLSTPVYYGDGELFGTLCGASSSSVDVDPQAIDVLNLFSSLISQQASREKAAELARLRADAAEMRASEMQFVAKVGALCLSAPDLPTVLKSIALSFQTRRYWTTAIPFVCHDGQCQALETHHRGFETLIAALVAKSRAGNTYLPLFTKANYADEAIQKALADTGQAPGSLLFVMIAASGDHMHGGVLLVGADTQIASSEQAMVQSCWQTITLFAERLHEQQLLEAANRQLMLYARHDPLTELPNRRYLVEEMQRLLSHAARSNEVIYVAFIDFDGFKKINDEHGHDVGDEFLKAMALRLRNVCRQGDMPARYGGDEFVLIAANHEDQVDGAEAAIAQRIEQAMSGEIQLSNMTLNYAGPSVGVIAWRGNDTPDADTLLASADKAMYAVKMRRRAARA
jgi:diguanylate cyclase (GGDEF)-like protein